MDSLNQSIKDVSDHLDKGRRALAIAVEGLQLIRNNGHREPAASERADKTLKALIQELK